MARIAIPKEYCSPFRKSAMRAKLWAGMEIWVLIAILYICFMTFISFVNFEGVVICAIEGSVLFKLGRLLAKYDPKFTVVHRASFAYPARFHSAWPRLPRFVRVRTK